MRSVVYIDRLSLPWAARWIAAHASESALLLAVEGCESDVRAMVASVAGAAEVFPCTGIGEAMQARLRVEAGAVLVLPRAVPNTRLDLFPTDYAPALDSVYPLIQTFSRMGIFDFRVWNAAGELALHLPARFEEFAGRHQGQRCFVVGNGPSLNAIDMTRLKDEITFGCNQCYLGYERWGFPFTYWGISDEYQIHAYGPDYERNVPKDTPKFCPLRYWPLLHMENLTPVAVENGHGPRHCALQEPLGSGHSVVYMLLQIAAAMGCNPIVLVGMDHRYGLNESRWSTLGRNLREEVVRPLRGTFFYHAVRTWRESRGREQALLPMTHLRHWDADMAQGPTHFHENYTQGGARKFALPHPQEAERDYRHLAQAFGEQGIEVLNATPNTGLHEFPKVDFDTLF